MIGSSFGCPVRLAAAEKEENMTTAQFLMIFTIIVYLVGMVYVGFYFSRKGSGSSSSDFYLGDRKLGPLVTSTSSRISAMPLLLSAQRRHKAQQHQQRGKHESRRHRRTHEDLLRVARGEQRLQIAVLNDLFQ